MSTYLLPKLSSSFSSFSTKSSFPLAIEEEEEDEEDEPVAQNFKNQPKERQSWLFKGIRSMRRSLNFGSTSPFAQGSHVSSFLSDEKELHIEGVQFGKPLTSPTKVKWFPQLLRRTNSAGVIHGKNPFLPVLVVACVQRLQLDLTVEGLFRLCGEGAQVSRLRQAWEIGGSLSNLSELLLHEPPHNVAALLVQYLCLLPEPLLPTRLFWDFLRVGKKGQGESILSPQILQRTRRLIAKIPTEHRALLSYLISFLVSVAAHEKANRMTARNLSLVFGPVIMRWPKNVNDITLLKVQANVVEMLITHHDVIFTQTDSSLNGTLDQIHDFERRGENDRLPFASSGFASSFFGEDVFELQA